MASEQVPWLYMLDFEPLVALGEFKVPNATKYSISFYQDILLANINAFLLDSSSLVNR